MERGGRMRIVLDANIVAALIIPRVIGLTLPKLKRIPVTITMATGQDKARAILGGLRTGVISVLCTDDRTARDVLQLDGV